MSALYEVYKLGMLFLVSIFSVSTFMLSLILVVYTVASRKDKNKKKFDDHIEMFNKIHNGKMKYLKNGE